MRAAEALAAHVRELKLEAQNAAANPRLVAALRGNADAATLQDLFRTEDWWEPYRNAFKVYAVAFESDKLDVIEGMKTAELRVRPDRAGGARAQGGGRRDRHGQGLAVRGGRGGRRAARARTIPAVLVLAKPIDDAAVRKLAEKARGAVLLSDGKRAVIEAGADAETELLRAAVGARDARADLPRADGRHLGGRGQPAGARPVAVDVRERRGRRARGREHRRRRPAGDLGRRRRLVALHGAGHRPAAQAGGGRVRARPARLGGRARPASTTRTPSAASFRSRPNLTPGVPGTGSQRSAADAKTRQHRRRRQPDGRARAAADGVKTSPSAATGWSICSARAAWPRSTRR